MDYGGERETSALRHQNLSVELSLLYGLQTHVPLITRGQ